MKYLRFWFPVFIYSGIIFYASSVPSVKTPGIAHFDKLLHICEYLPFGFLLTRALRLSFESVSIRVLCGFSVFLGVLYALSDEYHQLFVVGRDASLYDILADSLGIVLGCWVFCQIKLKIKKGMG